MPSSISSWRFSVYRLLLITNTEMKSSQSLPLKQNGCLYHLASERHETIKRDFSRSLLEHANSGSDNKVIINSPHKRCNRKYSGISKLPKHSLLIDCKIVAFIKAPGDFSYKCNVRKEKRRRRRERERVLSLRQI